MRKDHYEVLRIAIGESLSKDGGDDDDLLTRYKECVQLAKEAIMLVRTELAGGAFADVSEEIWFYKEEAPKLWGAYLYYMHLVELEAQRRSLSPERFHTLLKSELQKAQTFPEEQAICKYYYLGKTDSDEAYFTRGGTERLRGEAMGILLDGNITVGAYWLAQMRSYHWLKDWLANALNQMEHPLRNPQQNHVGCLAAPTEIVELLKAMHEIGFFEKVTFKQIMSWFEQVTGKKVENYDILLSQMQKRKMDRTVYLDKLKTALIQYMDKKLKKNLA